MSAKLTNAQIAWRAAQDIPDGAYVNLGIGFPEMVAKFKPEGREVIFHTENGILDFGEAPPAGEEDWDLINAGKKAVTLKPGAPSSIMPTASRWCAAGISTSHPRRLRGGGKRRSRQLEHRAGGAGGRRRDGPRPWRQARRRHHRPRHQGRQAEAREEMQPAADRRRLRDHGLYQSGGDRYRERAVCAARKAAGACSLEELQGLTGATLTVNGSVADLVVPEV